MVLVIKPRNKSIVHVLCLYIFSYRWVVKNLFKPLSNLLSEWPFQVVTRCGSWDGSVSALYASGPEIDPCI